jgi:hypothetical protein
VVAAEADHADVARDDAFVLVEYRSPLDGADGEDRCLRRVECAQPR